MKIRTIRHKKGSPIQMLKLITNLTLIASLTFTTITFAMASVKKDTYILAVGPKGARRLELQNDLLKNHIATHLNATGLSEGQTAVDLGCGNGTVTIELAKRVGTTGRVYAIDMSPEQLALAKEKVNAAGLKNVIFVQGDITFLKDFPMGKAHLVYMRFFLSHLRDPEQAIAIAKDMLTDGGVVATQDVTMSTFYDSSNHQIFREYRQAVAAMGKIMRKDFDIGKRLLSLHEKAGFVKAKGYFIQPTMNLSVTKELFLLDISEWTDKAIAEGVLTEKTVENWKNTISNWPNTEERFTMANYAFVLGRKAQS